MVARGLQRGKQEIATSDGVLRPTVVELAADGATVESPHANVGGTATTTVAFKMNVWADGGTMTLTPFTTTTGVTFSAVVVPAKGITSANSTCTVTAGQPALADVPISIAFSGSATNKPADITVTGSNTLAMTAGAASFTNLPWKSSTTANGWTQIRNLPSGTGQWYTGNDLSGQAADSTFDSTHNVANKGNNSVEWHESSANALSNWNQIAFQTMDTSGTNGYPRFWFILTRTVWDTNISASFRNVSVAPIAAS